MPGDDRSWFQGSQGDIVIFADACREARRNHRNVWDLEAPEIHASIGPWRGNEVGPVAEHRRPRTTWRAGRPSFFTSR